MVSKHWQYEILKYICFINYDKTNMSRRKVKTPSPPRRSESEEYSETEESVSLSDVDSSEGESETEPSTKSESKSSKIRKPRERKAAPVINFTTLWTNASKHPPYNPTKAEQLLTYLETTNPFNNSEKNQQLQTLLKRLLSENPKPKDVKYLQSLNGVLTITIPEADITKLKELLLEILKTDNNFHYRTPITLLLPEDIQHLQSMTYPQSSEKIIAINNRSLVFEIISLLLQIGYPATVEYLTKLTQQEDNQTGLLFNLPTLKRARDKAALDLKLMKWKPKVEMGAVGCKRCKSLKLITYELQTKSADESTTKFYHCTECGSRGKYD